MDKGEMVFAVYAELIGRDVSYPDTSDIAAGLPVARRINRMGRAVLAFDGNLAFCADDHLLASFQSVEAALEAASEMHRRCDELPQLVGWPITLHVAIDILPARTRLTDTQINGIDQPDEGGAQRSRTDKLAELAALASDHEVVVSGEVFDELPEALRSNLARGVENPAGAEAYAFAWCDLPSRRHQELTRSVRMESRNCAHRIVLKQGRREKTLESDGCVLAVGRDSACHFIIRNAYVSRIHALIEIRADGCFIKDQSSNGTSILLASGEELNIRNDTVRLAGSGTIAFGTSIKCASTTECVSFEVVEKWSQVTTAAGDLQAPARSAGGGVARMG